MAGKRLEQTLAGHPRIAPSPFAPVGPPHLAGGWRYWRLRVEQGASEAAQPDLSPNIVTDRYCVQV